MFKGDPLDPGRGGLYRKEILLPGGSREELDSLKVRFSLSALVLVLIPILCIRLSLVARLTAMRSSKSSLAIALLLTSRACTESTFG